MKNKLSKIKKFLTLYVFLPVVMDMIIESLNRKSLLAGVQYMVEKPSLFLFNVLIIMLTLSVSMFFQREIFVLGLISMVWLLFGIANYVILHFRVTPFSAVDFTLISSAISVSGHYLSVLNIAMLLLAVVMLFVAGVCLFKRSARYQKKISRKGYLIAGSVVAVLALVIVFIHRSSASVQALSTEYTNISEAYENYGFVYCFANSLIDTGIKEPENYSEEAVKQITDSLEEESSAAGKPNIIMIQLESFFDVEYVEGLSFSEDPLPVFHSLQEKYSHGLLTVPTVGAGTVNTEFEVLTGMSQQDFGVSEYPYKTVLKNKASESICQDLKALGYTSHAVHNNTGTFYGRNKVFSNLGFDTFTSVEYMNDVTLNPNVWAKDDILTREILKTLDSTKDTDFTFAITVQSHGKYDGVASEKEQQPIRVSGAPEGKEEAYQYYVNELYEVDQMLGALIEELSQRDEKTVLVLYGDHLPSLDLQEEDLNNGDLYQTEYIIWDNIGLPVQEKNLKSYQLYSYVLEQLGIHEGTITRYHQQTEWDTESYELGLEMLEYDLLYGENYAYDGEAPFRQSLLQMGTDVIDIENVEEQEEGLLVTGTGYTPYCTVTLNGKTVETKWIDSKHLLLPDVETFQKRLSRDEEEQDLLQIQVETGDGVALSVEGLMKWSDTDAGKDALNR